VDMDVDMVNRLRGPVNPINYACECHRRICVDRIK